MPEIPLRHIFYKETVMPDNNRPDRKVRSSGGRIPVINDTGDTRHKYRRKKSIGINVGVVVLVVIFIFILAVSVMNILRKNNGESPSETFTYVDTAPPQEIKNVLTVDNSKVHDGDLILVNYQYPFDFENFSNDLVTVVENKNEYYSVTYSDSMLQRRVLELFNDFIGKFSKEVGESYIVLNSSYRSLEDQTTLYDDYRELYGEEYVLQYVATPGYSEHHTGLALDLTVKLADGTNVAIKEYEHYPTFVNMLLDYGFVNRYPENKYATTHINTEPWHFRYVGVPHSYIIDQMGICLEEYIELLKEYTPDTKVITVTGQTVTYGTFDELPECDYIIYYVPASEGGITEIVIPEGYTEENCRVSGNNIDGFIVTVVTKSS